MAKNYVGKYYKQKYQKKQQSSTNWGSVARYAYKGFKLASKVASIINAEKKYFDTDAAPTPDNSTGYVQIVNNPAQGDGASNRDGDSLKMDSVNVRVLMTRSTSSTISTQVRVILFIWNQPTSTPTLGDILETVTIDSPKNFDKQYMSKILYDKTFDLAVATSGLGSKHCHIYQQFKGKLAKRAHVEFAIASTNVNNNGVYIAFLSNEATNTPICNYYARTIFYDN